MNDEISLDFRRDVDPNTLYELTALLGEGSYGAVYRAKPRSTSAVHKEVAIKIIPDADDDLTALWREIRFLQVLRSPFVVSFIESFLFDNELWLAMELCDGGSLYDLKEAQKGSFRENDLQVIMAFCVMGLAHLHAQMSIHRDVKSGNILLTRDGRAKLADFGISAQLTDTIMKRRTVIGSPYWMAPEVIQETSYDGKADMWSLGITLIELCEGSPPHFSIHPMRAIFIISSKPAPVLKDQERWSSDLHDFLSRCLVKDCDKRSSAAELLAHPWIARTVKEIGPSGKGSQMLADLVNRNWDDIERIRLARFKLPENIPVGGEGHGIENEPSPLDEDSMATMKYRTARSSNSSGLPATRQQIRNASLTRSLTASRRFSRGNSGLDQEEFSSTLVRRPLPSVQTQDGTLIRSATPSNGVPSEHKFASPDRSQFKISRPSSATTNDGTLIRSDPRRNSGNNDIDRDGTLVVRSGPGAFASSKMSAEDEFGSAEVGTFARKKVPDAKNTDANRNDMQAALRYFREESSAPLSPTTPPVSEPKKENAAPRSLAVKEIDQDEVYRTYDSKEVVLSPSRRTDSELDLLNTLTLSGSSDDPMKELLRKELLKQISVLKRQYRNDLEKLTQSYETRRKALKDALLSLSEGSDPTVPTSHQKSKGSLSANKSDKKKGN